MNFVEKLIKGDIRTAARLMRQIDDRSPNYRDKLKKYIHIPVMLISWGLQVCQAQGKAR